LESGDQHDPALVERRPQPGRGDVDDLGLAVDAGGDDPGLRTGERAGLRAERFDGHRHQRVGDAFTGGEQHVQLAGRRGRAHLLGQIQQVSVVSPIAETTTTTSLPCFLASTMRSATRRIRSASATEDPPYFCTTSATVVLSGPKGTGE